MRNLLNIKCDFRSKLFDKTQAFLGRVRERGMRGVRLVTSDAHEGPGRAVEEAFLGAAWQRRAVHFMRD